MIPGTGDGAARAPAIEAQDLTLNLSGTVVLEQVSFRLPRGEFLGILGPNGAGKTMLLRVLLGLVRPTSGGVHVLGEEPRRSRSRVGYVPQYASFQRDFPIRVEDVVLTGTLTRERVGRRPSAADCEAARRVLETMRIASLAGRQIGRISGGQLQRVLIARALVGDPDVLLLDEPTASLDPAAATALYALLAEMRERRTIVMVAHDVGVITQHVTSVACLNRRLFFHRTSEVSREMIEETYGREMGVVLHAHPEGHDYHAR